MSREITASRPTSANSPSEMFAHLVLQPIPQEVTDLQGTGDTWQGYDMYLRFQASQDVQEKIIRDGLQAMDCREEHLRLPNRHYDIFKQPPWGELQLGAGQCFEKIGIQNRWTHSGTHFLHVNPQNHVIHFHGIGS